MNHLRAKTAMTASVGNTCVGVYTYAPEIKENERIHDRLIHMHHTEEFFYIYNGTVKLSISDGHREIELNKGDLCMIPAGMYHCAHSDSAERICFEARIVTENIATDPTAKKYNEILRTLRCLEKPTVIRSPYIDSAMECYRELCKKDSATLSVSGTAMMMSVVILALDSVSTDHAVAKLTALKTREYERKQIIERFIAEYFANKCCLSMLSEALCLSERRTSAVVRDIMHKSFKELIVDERMRVADMLIKTGKYSLEEVAETVGYGSYSGFYTAWLGFYGHSPTEHI